jgi:hypothetical protein
MFSAPGAAISPSERQEAAAAGQGEPAPNPVSLIKEAMDGARIPPQYRADLIGHFCNAWIAWQARASLPASPSQGQARCGFRVSKVVIGRAGGQELAVTGWYDDVVYVAAPSPAQGDA